MNWLGDNLGTIAVLALLVVVGWKVLDRLAIWLTRSEVRSGTMAFCDLCGWKGRVARRNRACGRCGSLKLTLRTT